MTFILLIVLSGLQYKLWFGDGSVRDLLKLQKKAEKQLIANQKLDEKNTSLVADIKELKSGNQALEEQARQIFGMVRDDEVYYQIVENPPHQQPNQSSRSSHANLSYRHTHPKKENERSAHSSH